MEANSLDGFVPVAQVDEVPPGQARRVKVNGKTIALFNVAGIFQAINNICPHKGGSLAKGRVKGQVVSCPLHHHQFDVRKSGRVMAVTPSAIMRESTGGISRTVITRVGSGEAGN